ncbi:hypothetical protein [Gayadomonas joobiniege]|uniref:hypothetical protein n=1 Tax=Gayadomonas joobiniege TaxID=1234606 RepID=UPI001ED98ABA|nr:hypothetical protein [Gayadomonas joobiniege]
MTKAFLSVILLASFMLLNIGSQTAIADNLQMQSAYTQISADATGDNKLTSTQAGLVDKVPAQYPAESPQSSRLTQPSHFLDTEQQPDYQLFYAIAEPDIPPVERYRLKSPIKPPWYQCTSRPRTGAIDNCRPANLTYRSQLTFAHTS